MNPHAEIAHLRERNAQLRGELRLERGSKAHLSTLLVRMMRLVATVTDELHPERIPELDILLAHTREVLEAELERSAS